MDAHGLRFAILSAAAMLCACSAPVPESSSDEPYSAVADVQQLMATIVDPAADTYWDAVGWIDDEIEGTTEVRPASEEEWEAVRNAAFLVAESGNLLMMEGRGPSDPAWIPMARALVDVGRTAIAAADARDELAVFNAGAEVYYACTACHARFARETLPPADERAQSGGS